ncbi:hypothetical protein [Candidatus Tokpelaia sp.]|uniref:hypothetical protein n=1 Tax=Candidatus Tokpelaia sp. TaxID=2233777 RepID=UPI001239285E|nr:hypothetical protein [Candidatus Tokpelaia sp.]KAA6406269.1 hypothetical protein DPQ22_00145 [Candidatus Tokpelaia sp.]
MIKPVSPVYWGGADVGVIMDGAARPLLPLFYLGPVVQKPADESEMQDIFDHMDWPLPERANKSGLPAFIRPGEMLEDLFADDQLVLFQKRTALFMRRSFPAYTGTLTANELEKLALKVQKRAALKGFITEKQIWHYVIAVVYCGFFFEQDMQYADMLSLIGWHETYSDKMLLLDRLLGIIDEYAVECEKDFTDFDKKLRYIAEFYAGPHFGNSVLENMSLPERLALGEKILETIFPVRAGLWTAQTRHKLVSMSLDYARNLGFSVKDSLFYLLANIYFGRAFEQSPLYPWAYFLQNRTIPAADRARHFISLAQKHFARLAGG